MIQKPFFSCPRSHGLTHSLNLLTPSLMASSRIVVSQEGLGPSTQWGLNRHSEAVGKHQLSGRVPHHLCVCHMNLIFLRRVPDAGGVTSLFMVTVLLAGGTGIQTDLNLNALHVWKAATYAPQILGEPNDKENAMENLLWQLPQKRIIDYVNAKHYISILPAFPKRLSLYLVKLIIKLPFVAE